MRKVALNQTDFLAWCRLYMCTAIISTQDVRKMQPNSHHITVSHNSCRNLERLLKADMFFPNWFSQYKQLSVVHPGCFFVWSRV